MPAVLPHYKQGPANYQAATLIFGGMVITPNAPGTPGDLTVRPALAASAVADAKAMVGIAGNDANVLTAQTAAANAYGQPQIDISVLTDYVDVYYGGVDIFVWYSAACQFGQFLTVSAVATAIGMVTPYVTGTTVYDAIVGKCTQPGGVLAPTALPPWGGTVNARLARARIL